MAFMEPLWNPYEPSFEPAYGPLLPYLNPKAWVLPTIQQQSTLKRATIQGLIYPIL